jgi:hypothetical protein
MAMFRAAPIDFSSLNCPNIPSLFHLAQPPSFHCEDPCRAQLHHSLAQNFNFIRAAYGPMSNLEALVHRLTNTSHSDLANFMHASENHDHCHEKTALVRVLTHLEEGAHNPFQGLLPEQDYLAANREAAKLLQSWPDDSSARSFSPVSDSPPVPDPSHQMHAQASDFPDLAFKLDCRAINGTQLTDQSFLDDQSPENQDALVHGQPALLPESSENPYGGLVFHQDEFLQVSNIRLPHMQEFSISVWFKTDHSHPPPHIGEIATFLGYPSNSMLPPLRVTALLDAGEIRFRFQGENSRGWVFSGFPIADDDWHCLSVVRNHDQLMLTVDDEYHIGRWPTSVETNAYELRFGDHFQGALARMHFFSRALTYAEEAALCHAVSPSSELDPSTSPTPTSSSSTSAPLLAAHHTSDLSAGSIAAIIIVIILILIGSPIGALFLCRFIKNRRQRRPPSPIRFNPSALPHHSRAPVQENNSPPRSMQPPPKKNHIVHFQSHPTTPPPPSSSSPSPFHSAPLHLHPPQSQPQHPLPSAPPPPNEEESQPFYAWPSPPPHPLAPHPFPPVDQHAHVDPEAVLLPLSNDHPHPPPLLPSAPPDPFAQEDYPLPLTPPNAPERFLCKITSNLMLHPVILLPGGHSYERKAIKEWIRRARESHHVDFVEPSTGKRILISKCQLAENHTLRQAIDEWCEEQAKLNHE